MARRDTPPRDRILAAAQVEFAERGLAGARIDTIAREAEASKERLYAHFRTKRELFDTALGASVDRWVSAVPFDAHDMPGWASRLYVHFAEHIDDARMLLWGQIEGVTYVAPGIVNHEELEGRRSAMLAAQEAGDISLDWRPDELGTIVFGLVLSWFVTPQWQSAHSDEDTARRAEVVREATARIVGKD
ncbi:TetR family transcriptional regulator [Frondihabitans australicus]|uniref:TetR family transcriptional regulator n=1 Tax=Frondihabitans australicus TaxID=386892 RepID=A0A495IAJ1_9MICO|nr:TetR family transcriptional regulator [Frondihabitans australicus]RKR73033.1 TetR family transcriptional regulator [Frondihabitans australicus]